MLLAVAIPKTNSVPSRLRRRSAGRGGTLRDANGGGAPPDQANQRGTVQKVDVTIGNWDQEQAEGLEEAVGTYVQYSGSGVPDINDSVELTPVTFSCSPEDIPPQSILRITHSGPGTLYMADSEAGVLQQDGYDEDGVYCISIDLRWGNRDNDVTLEDIDLFMLRQLNLVPTDSIDDATVVYYEGFHAAKRKKCPCGQGQWILWESKMGKGIRLEHLYNQITQYGDPVRFYAPPRSIAEIIQKELK